MNSFFKEFYNGNLEKHFGVREESGQKLVKEIVEAFDNLPLRDIKKPKVGVVGEILVKYHPDANNNIVDIIERRFSMKEALSG